MRKHGQRDRGHKEQAPDPDHLRVAEAVGERPPKERAEDAGKGEDRDSRARGGVRGPERINAVKREETIDPGVAGRPQDDKDRQFRERLPVVRLRLFRDRRRCRFHRLHAFVRHLDSGAEEKERHADRERHDRVKSHAVKSERRNKRDREKRPRAEAAAPAH